MQHDWILDVLVDLKNVARANGLPAVAEKLTETTDLAMIEIASVEKRVRSQHGGDGTFGLHSGGTGSSRRA